MTAAIRSRWWEYLLSIVFANKSKVSYYWVQKKELHKKLSDFSVMWKVQTTFICVFVHRNTKGHNLVKNFSTNYLLSFTLPLHIFYQLPQQFVWPEPIGLPKQLPCHLPCLTYFQELCVSYLNFSINNIKRKNDGRKMFMTNNKTKLHNPIAYFSIKYFW